ncbi:MAG TPA: aldehyde dehydrogenase family protein [Pyrinomonadaceae bacterium]|nr:aldehyde dehydrogenase family protein [Pyrinomonadaceae bacterium]
MQNVKAQPEQPSEIISRDPATGEVIGRVPITSVDEVQAAVARARQVQPLWANQSFKERARVVLKAREIVLAEIEDIALLISRETGKPVPEAISMEIAPTLDLMYYFANHIAKLLKPQKIDIGQYGLMGRSSTIIYQPLGVVGIISPWNFPWATPLDEVVMALMAGNAVVVKPSELTSLTALKIADVFNRAGLNEGLLQIVAGDGATGNALVEAGVDKIMFTGSVPTGKRVAEAAAKTLTPVVLELGGKDPLIVLADANIQNAARAAVWGAFANSGQACASVERCYVDESVAEAFIKAVVAETRGLQQGSPGEKQTDVGSMSNERQLRIVEDHIAEAVRGGAAVLTGGSTRRGAGWFHEPTVLTNVNHRMKIMRDETFGPVLPIMTFKSEAEAVRLANDSIYGLTACVWTSDISRGRRIAEQLAAGTVMINEVVYTHAIAQTPWGGVKQSGYGRTHGRLGLLELVSARHIHVNRLALIPDLWWFRYTPTAAKLFQGLAVHFTTGSVLKAGRLLPQVIRRLFERSTK